MADQQPRSISNQVTLVTQVKAALDARGQQWKTNCDSFQITGRVAWMLRDKGAKLIKKTQPQNGCYAYGQGYSHDAVAFPDGHVDMLQNAGPPANGNIPVWQWKDSGPPKPDDVADPFDLDAPVGPSPEQTVREQIRTLYLEMLHREPDQGGWDHWTNEVIAGHITLDGVREALKSDPAYKPDQPEEPTDPTKPIDPTDPTEPEPEGTVLDNIYAAVYAIHELQKVQAEYHRRTAEALDGIRRDLTATGHVLADLITAGGIGGLLKPRGADAPDATALDTTLTDTLARIEQALAKVQQTQERSTTIRLAGLPIARSTLDAVGTTGGKASTEKLEP